MVDGEASGSAVEVVLGAAVVLLVVVVVVVVGALVLVLGADRGRPRTLRPSAGSTQHASSSRHSEPLCNTWSSYTPRNRDDNAPKVP